MNYTVDDLQNKAKEIRIDCIRMLTKAGSGHPGGSLSAVDLLTVLFYDKIKRTKDNALSDNRHRFVLSKGHCVPVLYSIFSQVGIINKADLMTLRKINSPLQGHPDCVLFPYVEASTGSLGQGLSIAQGMAMAGKVDNKDYRVYCMVGDGEMQEGEIWEGLMSSAKYGLDNFCVILDYNKSQIDGTIKEVMNIEPLLDKVRAFNWHVIEIDGHDFVQIIDAYNEAESIKGKPSFIIAHTVKGKGVSFMEGKTEWHGKAPNYEEAEIAIKELGAGL